MLSRASSDAGTRLRRSKSASTVHSHRKSAPEPFNPDLAQQHAIVAATTAFVRAHASDTAEKATYKRSAELSRSKSSASRKSQGSHFPPRGSSTRSIHSQKANQSSTAFKAPGKLPQKGSTVATERFPLLHSHLTPSTLSVSSQPAAMSNENMRPNSQPKQTRPGTAASMASQQIRKARSMYYASSVQTGSPIARPPAKYLVTPPNVSPVLDSSLLSTKSADGYFQRPRSAVVSPLASPRPPTNVAPNEAVNKARDKYLQDFQQQQHHSQRQVKHKPSLFLAPFKKRQEKGKNKAAPSTRAASPGIDSSPLGDPTLGAVLHEFRPQKERRSISDSLRQRFKKVFRRTSSKATNLPVQQIEASRDYFGPDAARSHEAIPSPYLPPSFDVPSPDEDTLRRVRSRSPSLEAGRPAYARSSSRGSNRSLHSENAISSCTSRVTSWSNSSAGATLTQRDMKRLTVIHEAKDSIGSDAGHISAVPSTRYPPPHPAFAAFREPMPMDSLVEETSTPVDPKRVFSALMKEIDAPKDMDMQGFKHMSHMIPGSDSDVFISTTNREPHSSTSKPIHSSAAKDLRTSTDSDNQRPKSSYLRPESVSAQSKASSLTASSFKSLGRAFKATIRTVTPSGPKSAPLGLPTSIHDVVRSPTPDAMDSSPSTVAESGNFGMERSITSETALQQGSQTPTISYAPIIATPTADQIETRVQKAQSRWKTPLEGNHVPFFRPTKGPYAVSNIEQGKIMQQESKQPFSGNDSQETLPKEIVETRNNTAPASPTSPKPRPLFSPLSPSVYSRNTDGASLHPTDSAMSLDSIVDDNDDQGSAIIITSRAVKSFVIGSSTPQPITQSGRSSRDWKAWLSKEVSELSSSRHDEISIQEQFDTPTRHHRELTEISIDEHTTRANAIATSLASDTSKYPTQTPSTQDLSKGTSTSPPESPDCFPPPLSTPQTAITRLPLGPVVDKRRPSIQSDDSSPVCSESSLTRPKPGDRRSALMNERFPFIDTGRRSSSNSGRLSHHTPSLPDSGSSSLKSNKVTPNSKVYSDFSAPSTNRTSKHEPNTRLKRTETVEGTKHLEGSDAAPATAAKIPSGAPNVYSNAIERTEPLQPLHLAPNPVFSVYPRHPTSVENVKPQPTTNYGEPSTPRVRVRIRPASPNKLTMRPKSAFDLRANTLPEKSPSLGGSDSPRKRVLQTRKSAIDCGADEYALRMMMLSSSRAAATFSTQTPSPKSSIAEAREKKPTLHMKKSSSQLALNKEPSPGGEERGIDSVLEKDDYFEPARCGSATPATGRATPGHKMAERFLLERKAGSGAGSPVSDIDKDNEEIFSRENCMAVESVSGRRSETATPAFL